MMFAKYFNTTPLYFGGGGRFFRGHAVHVPLFTKQYKLVPANGGDALKLGM